MRRAFLAVYMVDKRRLNWLVFWCGHSQDTSRDSIDGYTVQRPRGLPCHTIHHPGQEYKPRLDSDVSIKRALYPRLEHVEGFYERRRFFVGQYTPEEPLGRDDLYLCLVTLFFRFVHM